jgi:hypothetical protein
VIVLGIILLIIGIFAAREVMWPVGAICVIAGLLFMLLSHGTYAYY